MNAVYVTGSGACLPNEPVDNERIEAVLGLVQDHPSRVARRVLRSNGIRTRHYALDPETHQPTHSNAQLTAEAVRALADDGGLDLADLKLLSCGTSTPDQLLPNHGVMVHGELGGGACEVVTTTGVCVSGVTALKHAWLNVGAGLCEHAVATGSELASAAFAARHFGPELTARLAAHEDHPAIAFSQDFLRFMLSDGAGAWLLRDTPKPATGGPALRLDWIEVVSFAHEMDACMYWGAVKRDDGSLQGWLGADDPAERVQGGFLNITQDIKQLNAHVIPYTIGRALEHVRGKRALAPGDVDWFLPHYSSHYFRPIVREVMLQSDFDVPEERWFTNLYERGNTGAASIFLMLDELRRTRELEPGQKVLCWVPESGRFSAAFFQLTVVDEDGRPE